jgi:Dienelactone hydrolase family
MWGKEKVVEDEYEHPYLTAFKRRSYGGKSIAAELARQGYVVIAIDMFYWGERRMILDDDPASYRERPATITEQEIQAFNQRASQNESLVGRSLFTAGVTWPGVVLWDDIRTLDYLAARPDVDASRLGCVGLSVGGYRSFLLAALDERIKAAVDVGWMTSFTSQLKEHVIDTVGLSFHINGLYRYMDHGATYVVFTVV